MKQSGDSKKKSYQLVKGMKDILPSDARYFAHMNRLADQLAQIYGYGKIETPILENTELFFRGIGSATDIVEKEMFSFEDQSGDHLTLRPENTAGVVRAYIEHGMQTWPQPVKLYYSGSMFRHEKPQAGRFRQFNQIGFEVLGEADPIMDAQMILIAYKFCELNGFSCVMQVNSIGCADCRPSYEQELKDYFKRVKGRLSEISQARLAKNVLRILDSKEEQDLPLIAEAPQQIDFLCEDCKNHFIQVLEYLDELEIPYALNPNIVRGLDYYNRTAFEIWTTGEEAGRQSALGGGGRYDGLAEMLGGQPVPAVGFAIGVERFINQIKEADHKVPDTPKPEIFLAQLGPEARKKGLKLFEALLKEGIKVGENFAKTGLKAQLETADKLGVKFTLILGQKEIVDGTIMIRDMENGIQEVVDCAKVTAEIKKRLAKIAVIE